MAPELRQVLRDGQLVADPFVHVDDKTALPASDIIVSLTRWQSEFEVLRNRPGRVGVRLANTDDVTSLAGTLDAVATVALEFPKFADGRAYSMARLLRDSLGYVGEIRATGDVLRDQLFYMKRVGFDVFEVRQDKDAEREANGLKDFSVSYQRGMPGPMR